MDWLTQKLGSPMMTFCMLESSCSFQETRSPSPTLKAWRVVGTSPCSKSEEPGDPSMGTATENMVLTQEGSNKSRASLLHYFLSVPPVCGTVLLTFRTGLHLTSNPHSGLPWKHLKHTGVCFADFLGGLSSLRPTATVSHHFLCPLPLPRGRAQLVCSQSLWFSSRQSWELELMQILTQQDTELL